jgi:sulfide:quinone oxidoreductase
MPDVAFLDPTVAISPQLVPSDFENIAAQGFRVFVNNRPDGEAWFGQPLHDALDTAAIAAGVTPHFLPFTLKSLQSEDVRRFQRIISGDNRVLASCASGFRSALLWAMARIAYSGREFEDVMQAAAAAGQPLEKHRALIERMVSELRE